MKAFILFIVLIIGSLIFIPTTVDVKKEYAPFFLDKQKVSYNQLRVTFFGVSSLLIEDKNNSILIDGFFSRPSLLNLLFTPLQSDATTINKVLKENGINNLDLLLTLHSHHDHAMDVGLVALKTKAIIAATSSTLNIAKAYNLPDNQMKEIKGKTILKLGDFTITLIPSKHTHMGSLLSEMVGLGEHITKTHHQKEYLDAYKEGDTYSIHIKHPNHSLFINGSTAYTKELTQGLQAQTVFLGIAKLGKHSQAFQEDYYKTVVEDLNAHTVIPVHWDDFTKSFEEPISSLPFFFDDFNSSMDFLIHKSQQNKTELILMDFFDIMALEKSSKK